MKKYFLILTAIAFSLINSANAQVNDTTDIDIEDFDIDFDTADIERMVNAFAVYENTVTGFKNNISLSVSYGVLSWSSMNEAGDLFSSPDGTYDISLMKSKRFAVSVLSKYQFTKSFMLHFGLGIESDVFRLGNNVTFDGNSLTQSSDKTKAKLVARYVTLPLIFEFKRPTSRWGISLGAVAGVNYNNSHTGFKRHYIENGVHTDQNWGKQYKNFNRWKLDGRISVSYKQINLNLQQSILPVFKDGKERKLYPFSIGIGLGL
ncbi:MAG: outer membrane beta-barrel protein [Bacteroidales bacterium]|nr:outer membrane beta-barrel protein [Bacteroidales bacterium]